MRFWDSSALVPLMLLEEESESIRHLFTEDPRPLVWAMTGVELTSAVWRKWRAGELGDEARDLATASLADLERTWITVVDLAHVLTRARRILATHALRAADSCQLAAALHASRERPQVMEFVTLDERLADAARKEGFRVRPG